MRVACFVLLSLCAFASAAVTLENNARQNAIFEHTLGRSEYQLSLVDPKADLFTDADFAATFNSLSVQERSLFADQITTLLESFRGVIVSGNDQLPVLDPFVWDQFGPFQVTASGIRGQGSINNFRVEGLQWYLVDRVTVNAFRLSLGVQVTIPWIITTGSYDAQASIAFLTHNAGGDFRVFVNRLVVGVDVRVGTNLGGGHLVLRNLDINIDVHDTNIQIVGLFGSGLINRFINSFVQSLTQEVIQSEMQNVSALLSEQLFEVVNEVLREFTLGDLIGNN